MVDMYGFSLAESFNPLLAAIAASDPEAAVVWFSWVDESATAGEVFAGAQSLSHTQINGARLANALIIACEGPLPLPRFQLIGHSHGSVVATHAALALPTTPDQLTLLDCPEDWISRVGGSAGLLAEILPRLEPGRGPGEVLVDSYTSMFGRPYHRHPGLSDVVDVRLASALRLRDSRGVVGDAHEYALEWYAETVRSADPKSGFGWSVLGADRPQAGVGDFDPEGLAAGYFVQGGRRPVAISQRDAVPTRPRSEAATLGLEEIELTAEHPDVAIGVLLADVDLVEFDYTITDPARRTRLEGAVERVPAFSGASGEFTVPSWGQYLRIRGDRDPSVPVLIQFRLVDAEPSSRVSVTNVRAVRTGVRARNYHATRTATAIAVAGAIGGAVGTLAVQGLARAVRGQLAKR